MDQDYSTQQLLMINSSSSTHHHQDHQDQNTNKNNNSSISTTTGAAGNGGRSNSSPSPDHHHHHQNYHHLLPSAMNTTTSTTFHLLHDQSAAAAAAAVTTAHEDQQQSYSHHFLSPPPPPSHNQSATTTTQIKVEPTPTNIALHHQQQHQFHYSSLVRGHENHQQTVLAHHQRQQQQLLQLQLQNNLHHYPQQQQHRLLQESCNIGINSIASHDHVDAIKAKIITHPQYSSLLEAYMDCQKVGAPAEVVAKLTEARHDFLTRQKSSLMASSSSSSSSPQADPELDQFMEAYYDMLVKYREELTRPLQEAMDFMRRIEAQLNSLNNGVPIRVPTDEKCEGVGSSEDDQENSGGEAELVPEIDPRAEDRELKNHLLKKYSGYLSSLKQELSKKKKKGKLPKEARQKLLSWWEMHYKWPYPSETEKVALAESTGLDQKQINNWFINQRKRHWKPSEDMQFVVMEGLHPQSAALYMDGHFIGDGHYRLGP